MESQLDHGDSASESRTRKEGPEGGRNVVGLEGWGEKLPRERADSPGPSWPWDLAPCVGDITGGSAGGETWANLALPGRPRGERGWETREELLPCRAPWPLASPMEEGERWTPLGTCAARAVDRLMHWTREAGKDQAKTTTLRPTRLLQPALPVVERGR